MDKLLIVTLVVVAASEQFHFDLDLYTESNCTGTVERRHVSSGACTVIGSTSVTVTGECSAMKARLYNSSTCTGTAVEATYHWTNGGPNTCAQYGDTRYKIQKCSTDSSSSSELGMALGITAGVLLFVCYFRTPLADIMSQCGLWLGS